jgi:hypothetical protein
MTQPADERRNQDHAIRIALLEQSMTGIKSELHQINSNINRLVWAVIAAIVMAGVQFILKGGLNV